MVLESRVRRSHVVSERIWAPTRRGMLHRLAAGARLQETAHGGL